MSHESLLRDETIEPSSNRAFGFVFATVFALIGALPLLSGDSVRAWSLAVAAVFLAVALALPSVLTGLNRIWLRFGFFCTASSVPSCSAHVLPRGYATGLLMRLLGKDPLRLRYEDSASTYWIDRTPPGPPPESFDRQF